MLWTVYILAMSGGASPLGVGALHYLSYWQHIWWRYRCKSNARERLLPYLKPEPRHSAVLRRECLPGRQRCRQIILHICQHWSMRENLQSVSANTTTCRVESSASAEICRGIGMPTCFRLTVCLRCVSSPNLIPRIWCPSIAISTLGTNVSSMCMLYD